MDNGYPAVYTRFMVRKFQNSLIVAGDVWHLQSFVDLVHGDKLPFSFEKIIPRPVSDIKHGPQNWPPPSRKWAARTWGSETDAVFPKGESGLSVLPWSVAISFSTIGGSPEPVVAEVSKLCPDLYFDLLYSCEKTGNAGRSLLSEGVLLESTAYSPSTPEWKGAMASQRVDLASGAGSPPSVGGIFTSPLASVRELLGMNFAGTSGKPPPQGHGAENAKARIFEAAATAETALMAGLETAGSLGFSLVEWRKSGFLNSMRNAWRVRLGSGAGSVATTLWGRDYSAQLTPMCPAGVRAVLVTSKNALPLPNAGHVVRTVAGLELHTSSGWAVCIRCSPRGRSTVCLAKDGEWQDAPDKTEAAREYSYSVERGRVYQSAAAHFFSGNPWNPTKLLPAFKEFSPDGLLLRSADFAQGLQVGKLREHVPSSYRLPRGSVLSKGGTGARGGI